MEEALPELPLEIWERIYKHAHLLFARKFMLRSKIRRKNREYSNIKAYFSGDSPCECWVGSIYPSYIGPCESCRLDFDVAKGLIQEWRLSQEWRSLEEWSK